MKKNMNIALTKPFDPVEHFYEILSEFIETLKHSQKTFSDNLSFCRDLRTSRKKLEKEVKSVMKEFNSLSEKQQVEIELAFFKALQKLEAVVRLFNVSFSLAIIFFHSLIYLTEK